MPEYMSHGSGFIRLQGTCPVTPETTQLKDQLRCKAIGMYRSERLLLDILNVKYDDAF